jgi:mannose-6-phosphate isomerase
MTKSADVLMNECKIWLKEKVFPRWMRVGIYPDSKLFVENFSFDGEPQASHCRALVQSRQIYSFVEGVRLEILEKNVVRQIIENATDAFIQFYEKPNGSFIHAVDPKGSAVNEDVDLYTQAFALFGLAQTFSLSAKSSYKVAALKNIEYLKKERAVVTGGFTEIKSGKTMYQSNPHMHLFEALISWAEIDSDPTWKNQAREIFNLCKTHFLDPATGVLGEHFNERWEPLRENGQFMFEPGHQFEWCWLLYQYKRVCDPSADIGFANKLFAIAERVGLSPDKRLAYDEIWSGGSAKKKTSRFWPQSERVKAAIVMKNTNVADVSLQALIDYFLDMDRGLWKDTLMEDGTYANVPVKSSSLYHIINAMSEYLKYRPEIAA